MSQHTIPTAHAPLPHGHIRLLAVALAAALAAGAAATIDTSGPEHRSGPAKPQAWPSGPIEFHDGTVVKGARGATSSLRP